MILREKETTLEIIKEIGLMLKRNNISSCLDHLNDLFPVINSLFDKELIIIKAEAESNSYIISLKGNMESCYCEKVYSFHFINDNDYSSGIFTLDIEDDGSIEISITLESDFLLPICYDADVCHDGAGYLKTIDLDQCRSYFSETFSESSIEISIVA